MVLALFSACAPTPGVAPSGALKEQLYAIKQQQQQQAAQLQELQRQIRALRQHLPAEETPQKTAVLPNTPSISTPAVVVPPPRPTTPEVQQEVASVAASAASYLAAFSNLAAGNAAAAEAGFENFLNEFPDHQYTPNARYWLAEAQLAQEKTNLAITTLNQIITDPKAQTKAPAALQRVAQIYRQAGLAIQADNILEQLRERYPESLEAQQFNRSNEPID